MTQKSEITFEVEETVVVSQGEKIRSEYCPSCRKAAVMAPPRALALITGSTEREIFRLVEAGMIFFTEQDQIVACLKCLQECLREPEIASGQQA